MGDEEVTPVFLSGEQTCWGLSHPCLYSPLSCRDPAVQMEPPGRPSDPPLGWVADPSTVCRVVRLTFKHLMLRKEWKNLTSSLRCLLLVWDELVKNNIFLWSLMKNWLWRESKDAWKMWAFGLVWEHYSLSTAFWETRLKWLEVALVNLCQHWDSVFERKTGILYMMPMKGTSLKGKQL